MDDKTALAFNTICNFIRDLNASFGNKQKSLLLYGHLIEKTGLIHIDPVKKHINIFKKFVADNKEAIESQNKQKLTTHLISYSDKVSIDMKGIFQVCDKEEEKVIWNHLLTISAVLDPLGNAKQILKDLTANASSSKKGKAADVNEDNFLKNIMDKIGSEVGNFDQENMNPMQMIGTMMSSGALNDIFQSISSGLNDGNLDLGSMMNSMQSMVTNLSSMVNEQQSGNNNTTATATTITPTNSSMTLADTSSNTSSTTTTETS